MSLKKRTKDLKESDEQITIFKWANIYEMRYPQLRFMYSTLNGVKLSIGQAVKAKRNGMKKGVPDIVFPWNNGTYSGLYIELKVGYNKASTEQEEYIQFLRKNKYYADTKIGAVDAINCIKAYLSNEL